MTLAPRLRFDRQELAGAFGDIGTDLPLLIGLCVSAGLDSASVFSVFGLLQIATGVFYGIPMPVQPLKAMSAVMLTRHLAPGVLYAAGLVIGVVMLALSASGLLDRLARLVPRAVVRGIQLGLGLSLFRLAIGTYCRADGQPGILVAVASLALYLVLRRQRRVPAPLVLIGIGVGYALLRGTPLAHAASAFGLHLPTLRLPSRDELRQGALVLALPQLALSLGNSLLATSRATEDLFPERAVSVRKLGYTYALMNLVGPLFGGVPACHGCGGLVGFYNFGARTGGAAVIYGALYLVAGLLFAPALAELVQLFPLPILGVVLLIESVALMALVRDVRGERGGPVIAVLVAACVVTLSMGYLVGLLAGTFVAWTLEAIQQRRERT